MTPAPPVHVIRHELQQLFCPCPQMALLSLFPQNLLLLCIFTSFYSLLSQQKNVSLLFPCLNCHLCSLYHYFLTSFVKFFNDLLYILCLHLSASFSSSNRHAQFSLFLKTGLIQLFCTAHSAFLQLASQHLFWLASLLFSLGSAWVYHPFIFALKQSNNKIHIKAIHLLDLLSI